MSFPKAAHASAPYRSVGHPIGIGELVVRRKIDKSDRR